MKIYQVDSFTNELFRGNPAAVCPLDVWLPDELMQNIAAENNLAETAFYVKEADGFRIRWFTPKSEVDLCGHATLAAAWVMFNEEGFSGESIEFNSRSGPLKVYRSGEWLTLDFPADTISPIEATPELLECFNIPPKEVVKGKMDYLFIYRDQETIVKLEPRLKNIASFGSRGIIVSARGEKKDFVSRYFAPGVGIDEDPVTGSAHTTLAVYWSRTLGKDAFTAEQLSERKGLLRCELKGERVLISGQARLYLKGEITVN